MSCDDLGKNTSDNRQTAMIYETENNKEVAQEPALHISRFKQDEPPGNHPQASIKQEGLCIEPGPQTEGRVPDNNSTSSTAQLTRRANQLSDFLEMEIALDPSREKERLTLENYLGCVRRLLEGMMTDESQGVSEPALATDRKAEQKTGL